MVKQELLLIRKLMKKNVLQHQKNITVKQLMENTMTKKVMKLTKKNMKIVVQKKSTYTSMLKQQMLRLVVGQNGQTGKKQVAKLKLLLVLLLILTV